MKLIVMAVILMTLFININGYAGEKAGADRLSSELMQLATSENPEEFAKKHGMALIDKSVKVIIVTGDEFSDITERYGLKEVKRYKNNIEAIVPVKNLIPLGEEAGIKYIRRPYKLWKW